MNGIHWINLHFLPVKLKTKIEAMATFQSINSFGTMLLLNPYMDVNLLHVILCKVTKHTYNV